MISLFAFGIFYQVMLQI